MLKFALYGLIFILTPIKNKFLFIIYQWRWRKLNRHNGTYLKNLTPITNIKVGKRTYGFIDARSFCINSGEKLTIGNYVSIADDVKFLLGGNHQTNTITSYPLKANLTHKNLNIDARSKGPIIIEDEVWIGFGSIILSGVKIGKGAIIAACSVVTKDIPPYAISGGNPARIIKYRFNEDLIDALSDFYISNLDEKVIVENIEEFYLPLDIKQIEKLKKLV